ncbi:uncharacterized protein LOC100876131 [Megachile rotundata]|uniref:uncharacterized protein LOC100876131 n=1 Tax=Megachile rotundata TaxID=143995 RepID=UPI000258E0D1|nr:PREDICTED: uncharacterized protein LOC100876131 isoform X1 [Megachile rotundata]XP_012140552.1 PREDICTED: uncharacterized protein LOC100876131 isoform X1 [Megachile rotundata]XP_012140553.1 PREDICTED: uncharacterized protein LOC100876131 isoform X1 [Megachile rotundata]
MLKHILTGQPSSAGSRHHHNEYQASSGSLHGGHHHHHQQDQHHHYNQSGSVRPSGNGGRGVDVYDSVVHPASQQRGSVHQAATTPSSTHRHPLNHSQLSVNNLSQRLNHSHALNLSTLSTSKHSVNSVSPVAGGNNNNNNNVSNALGHTVVPAAPVHQDNRPKVNGGFDISRLSRLPSQTTPSPAPALQATVLSGQLTGGGGSIALPLNASWSSSLSRNHKDHEAGAKETLTSLGLLCLVSLLLALLSLIFLLKISPLTVTPSSLISPEEYTIVYEVTLALCALALSLNLCCLLVCAIQFLFTVKLVKTSYQGHWSNKYLQKSSISRICAVGGFFISIPVFLTGMILYTFIQFHSTPAIVTSVFIGLGIVFCGCAMVHNVFVWQREKTNAVKALAREQCEAAVQLQRQQQLQQHHSQPQLHQQQHQQQQQQQQLRAPLTMHHPGCTTKVGSLASQPNASHATHGRAAQYQHYHHHHHHRHVSSMSPPLLISSPAPMTATHNHLNVSSHRNVVTPPDTPGDRSPPSPGNKLNRSQHLPREASGSISPGLPAATLDLSSAATTNSPHELSTLV